MMPKILRNFRKACLLLVLLSVACGGSPTPEILPATESPAASPAPTETRATAAPTPVPSPTQPPPSGPQAIAPDNASQAVELARLGKGAIQAAPVFSPDGRLLALPTAAGVYLYDVNTFEEVTVIPQWSSFIAFSPDGSLLATSAVYSVLLWDPADGSLVRELPGNQEYWFWELSFSADGSLLSTHTSDMQTIVWSVSSGEQLYSLPGSSLAFSPDGSLAAVDILGEGKVYLHETMAGKEENKWNAQASGFAPDGRLWLAETESIRLADFAKDTISPPFEGSQPSFSSDGSLMALFAHEQIWLYDSHNGRRELLLEGKYNIVDQLLFSPDGETIAGDVYQLKCPTCTEVEGLDRFLTVWSLEDGSILSQTAHPVGWIAYTNDGSALVVTQEDAVQVLQAAEGSQVAQMDGFFAPVLGMALSPDGKSLAAAYAPEPYRLKFWDLEEEQIGGELDNTMEGAFDSLDLAYSPAGNLLAVGGHLWDLETGKHREKIERALVEASYCWPASLAISPQGDTLATGCFEGQLDLWDLADEKLARSLEGYSSWVNDLAFSPAGDQLAAVYGVPDYRVQVWSVPDGEQVFSFSGGHFTRVIYSPDGSILATIAANPDFEQNGQMAGSVQLWSASEVGASEVGASAGEELLELELDDAASLAFSPDGKVLATGSFDGTLRLWQVDGGELLWETSAGSAPLNQLAFTPDGVRLVASSQDGTISVWGIAPADETPG